MLSKFLSINNIGRFQNCNATGDAALKRFNLIFVENGRGKSTLCAILRSAQSNDPSYVIGRRTLGSADPPHVNLLTAIGSVTFKDGAWSQAMPQFAIFDSTFVAENVFSGDVVDLDHKRNLYRVIIGNAGLTLAQKVNDLDTQIRAATSTIKNKRATIDGRVPSSFGFDDFVSLAADPGIDTKITEKTNELEGVQQSAQLRTRASLSPITVPEVPTGLSELLQRTIAGLSATVEQRIAAHIAKHQMQETGEAWLQRGLA
jgi:wobble nucleotide-excising tRNase